MPVVTNVDPSRQSGSLEAAPAPAVFGVSFGTAVALVGRRPGGFDAAALLPYLFDVLASGLESIYPVREAICGHGFQCRFCKQKKKYNEENNWPQQTAEDNRRCILVYAIS